MTVPIATPGTMVPCDNPRGYKWAKHICRCVACRDLLIAEQKRLSVRRVLGIAEKRIKATKSRRIINHLHENQQVSLARIARDLGVSEDFLYAIRRGKHKTVREGFEKKLIALKDRYREDLPKDRFKSHMVDSGRAQRAVQGLMFQGYPQTWIADQVGTTSQIVSRWCLKITPHITRENEELLLKVVREVGLRPGPNKRISVIARNRGYQALAAWDDLL